MLAVECGVVSNPGPLGCSPRVRLLRCDDGMVLLFICLETCISILHWIPHRCVQCAAAALLVLAALWIDSWGTFRDVRRDFRIFLFISTRVA